MGKLTVLCALMIAFGHWGCQFVGGSASGNGTPVTGSDGNSHYQMNQLEEEYRVQRISRRDYEVRKGPVPLFDSQAVPAAIAPGCDRPMLS